MTAQFLIGAFVPTEAVAGSLYQLLSQQSFAVRWSQSTADFNDWVISNRHWIDCLIVESSQETLTALEGLKQRDKGPQIQESFRNFEGIISGSPRRVVNTEKNELSRILQGVQGKKKDIDDSLNT